MTTANLAGCNASTAEAASSRVGRGEQGEARRASSTPNGGPHLKLGRLRLKTWSKSDSSIAQTTGQHICTCYWLQVCARLINGAEVGIDATGEDPSVSIGGLYSSAAQIKSAGDVAVSACHGRLKVHTAGAVGAVTLSSVNGMAHVSTGTTAPCTDAQYLQYRVIPASASFLEEHGGAACLGLSLLRRCPAWCTDHQYAKLVDYTPCCNCINLNLVAKSRKQVCKFVKDIYAHVDLETNTRRVCVA